MKKLTLLICLLISFDLIAQQFSMVKEINTTATTSAIGATLIQRVGTTVYFVANDGISGNELWKSDGTSAGTILVKDINPGSASTSFANLTAGDGVLFFTANDGVHGFELWRTDGTGAGTFMLRDGFSECTFCLNRLFFHNGYLYFAGDDGTTGAELWKTDGTVAGTVLVKDIYPGPTMSHPAPTSGVNYTFVAVGNDVYFTAVDAVAGRELFKTDGTAAGTVMVKDIYPGATSSISTTAHKAGAFNGKLYFMASDGVSNAELWATDGTDAGTYLVKDIVPGGGVSQPNNLIAFNGALYFTASSTHLAIPDLWKTDGTEAGTVLIRNLVADGITLTIGNSVGVDQFTVANGKLFFRGTGPNGIELYASDGTTGGTGIVKDIYPGVNGVNLNSLFAYNDNVYFLGTDVGMPSRGGALYKSDGTAVGTVQVMDGESGGALGLSSITMTSAGGRLFFWGNTNDNGIELWSTDGTNANTALVKDINTVKTGTPNSGASVFGSLVHNGYYYYAAVDDTHGNELWKSDGTTAGTVMVKDIWTGKAPSNPAQFFVYGGAIYFTASDGLSGTELWKTDGTEAGTVMVADINPGPVNSGPNRFCISNNYLYFTAYHSLYGLEIWRSNGTAAGTTLVIDLVPGIANGAPGPIDVVSLGNSAYGIINIAAGNVLGIPAGNRLIKFDGVANTISDFASVVTTGTDLGIVGNTLYITGRNAANQTLLWKSENGGAVTQVKILSTTATNAYQLTNCGGKLYFAASNGAAAGTEPWISDGTDAGTYMLKDINSGANSSTPYQFIFSGGKVYFTASATGNTNGEYELWATDGTTAGTYLVKDILPGSTGSRPNATISAFGNKVLFTANNGASGYELWQSDGTAAGTFLLQEFNSNGDGIVPVTGVFFNFPTDFIYSKLGDKILFFARSADKGLQLYSGSIASPYKYVNDNSTTNDVFTTAVGNNANNGSQSAPYATLTYALSQASEGDTIYVDAGNYVEQVTVDKGITLLGAGSGLTIILKPAVINPPPGPFTEPGTIQSAQNIGDVHIRDMSVTGDGSTGVTPIILQTGGSIKNCRLIGGSQGIFFRVDPAIKTALIENNYLNIEYIGINCQGSGLTATLINNTIDLNNPTFAAGVFAGLDFGPLVRFTAFGNMINNYNAQGFLANSYNTNITQNSILGTGQHAIQQGTNSLAFATCNWFGTTNAAAIASKVNGLFSYTPYLTNGTNAIVNNGSGGFVPVAGSCGEGVNNFYVNDNSRTNDVFTTAVGNNSNPGTSVAPFATLSYAISVAPVNSVIHVDAGTYAEQVIIDKGIVINGAGKELTHFVKPAAALVPAPGPFTEIGLIETTQGIGDVHIRNISVNSVDGTSQNIIIQSGGSVKNCKLLNGGQGVFFRIESGARSANVEFNTIQPIGIGVNCQGAGLTATIVNNTISKPGGYYSGIFAGLDFGPLPQLTITNNSISDYFGTGMSVNSNGSNITNNRILGTGGRAIEQGSGNRLNATCNWYGSADPNIIVPKIYGNINYSPWLTNGTDNDAVALGFQPLPGVCNVRQNKFYVNDNSLTGDVFTTAVGDDNNGGVPAAPLLTLLTALTRAQAGDTIFVDAGTFAMANLTLNKSITILGANYMISPNDGVDKTKYNASRNAEALITGGTFIIGADWIFINGLRISSNTAISMNADFSHVKFDKNYFNVATTANTVSLQGATASPVMAFDFSMTDNRFERTDNLAGNAVFLGAVKNLWIDNNVFIESGVSVNRSTAIRTSTTLMVEAALISNNYLKKLSTAIAPFILKDVVISTNQFDSVSQGIVFVPGNIVSNNVSIIANNFYNLRSTRSVLVRAGSNGGINNFNVLNNTINQSVNGTGGIVSMIQLEFAAANNFGTATVSGNQINISGDYTLTNIGSNCGIQITGKHSNTTVANNELNFTAINHGTPLIAGVLPPVPSGIYVQTDGGINNGLIPATAIININNNKINGFKESVVFYDPVAGITPQTGFGYLTTGVIANINNNSFTGDSISIDNGTISQTVNANCNWYGSAAAQTVATKVTASTVNYTPWLNNGTDNDPGTGFQPLPGSCTGTVVTVVVDQSTNVNCNGANTGSIDVTVSGGNAPYTFDWTKDNLAGFASTEDINSIGAGVYQLTVTDVNGSVATTMPVIITEPPALTASANGTNINCFGGSDGSATVIATGGTGPYTYIWNNAATTNSISGLIAGNYTVTVTDANGCTAISSYEVTQPIQLTASASGTNVSIYSGSNGSASVTIGGGVEAYSYLWSNAAVTQSITNLSAGTYSVTVTDANGCTAQSAYEVTQPDQLTVSAAGTNASCFNGSNGSATVTVSGGVAAYSYLWSNGATTQSISNLSAATYSVTVTDANGATAQSSYEVTQPAQLTASAEGNNASCFGGSNGTATVTASGGTGAYSYLWSNGSTTQNISNLIAGIYTVTVTDANGCTAQSSYEVTQPAQLTAAAGGTNVSCFGGSNGSATVTVSGGTQPYGYLWSNNATSPSIINLSAGVYSVTVTDANGCIQTAAYTVTQPALLTLTMTGTTASCSGSATATPAGGTAPYSYNWSNGAATQSINGVPAGTYSVTITDARGCTTSGTRIITGNSPINPTASVIDVSCFGQANGSITVTGAGGTAPHTYSVNGSVFQTSNIFAGLSPGTYLVSAKDANGCVDFVPKTITQPALLTVVLDSIRTPCNGSATGRIFVTPTGGTGTKIYSWTGPNGYTSTTQDPNNIAAGNYSVTVTDAKGCAANLNVSLPEWPAITITEIVTHVACRLDFTGAINATVSGGTGSELTISWTGPSGFTAATEDISGLKAGNYRISVTDNTVACTVQKTITITQPATVVNISATRTNITTCGGAGTITATGSGGTSPYEYSVDGGTYQSSNTFNVFVAGTHTVTVRDDNGCTKTINVTISDTGSDSYESNNSRANAAAINIATTIDARIGPAGSDVDWFKFTTGNTAMVHTVSFSHLSAANYTFALYTNTGTLINPSGSSAGSKTYNSLTVNTIYNVRITSTAASLVCYQLSVSTAALRISGTLYTKGENPEKPELAEPKVTVFPNPHQGSFNIKIESPEAGMAKVELYDINGKKIEEKRTGMQKGGINVVGFTGKWQAVLFYRVYIGQHVINGKIIGPQ